MLGGVYRSADFGRNWYTVGVTSRTCTLEQRVSANLCSNNKSFTQGAVPACKDYANCVKDREP